MTTDDWDQAFEDEFQCTERNGKVAHEWYFPVSMGDWCLCAQKQWVDRDIDEPGGQSSLF